ncbi:ABC transporter ATP-binding protein [Paenibacillus sp. YN15]|uniref:ABC transporter ATP-binding protein n=1 Tax=Paenibacillus sp. YN15 TaxID=1742774 RepID=UPI000DCB8BAA|nr:ATP-binding cassette domain-containing protein [Paenibacillus sp. YN15]RAU93445.1 ABC transporter ATP-binding protein [Paenibacillus sp. YN15]
MPLEGKGLGYRYNKQDWIFRDVHIRIEPGEVVGLVGPSGCGKSTLGKLLAGHLAPRQGGISVNGAPATAPKGERNPVQLVLQHPEQAVNPKWKLRRTLAEAGMTDMEWLKELAVEEEWLDRYPNELSGGELQRICVARALGAGTRYLIADEMTTMLDAITQALLWHTVLQWAERSRSGILAVTHDAALAKRLCGRILYWSDLAE